MTFATHYNVGTVTVTAGSANVVGVGTFWVGNVEPGDILWVNGVSCRIQSIGSNTTLTLARNWPGATAAGAYYEAWAVLDAVGYQQKTKELLTKLASGNVDALAGLNPIADTFPFFTGPGTAALATVTAQARALLDDPTVASMLLTLGISAGVARLAPVVADCNSVMDSGWTVASDTTSNRPPGASYWFVFTLYWPNGSHAVQIAWGAFTTQQLSMKRYRNNDGSWTAWAAAGSTVVGTVSQTGGVPTGASMQRVSNANGEGIRLADGTQILWSYREATVITSTTTIANFWFFPAAFAATPTLSVTATRDWAGGTARAESMATKTSDDSNTGSNIWANSPTGVIQANDKFRMHAIALGRWF
ncbi:hypothetical protein [Shinella sp. G-2]|uniref:hypothetical protein n=1 Tax=Shinella sp. G-2 TaxID=3133141 RepID=UPI003D0658F1